MDEFKIVADSSADMLSLSQVPFSSAPLKIVISGNEYVDDAELDVGNMVEKLAESKTKSTTSCPNISDWLKAFGDAKYVFCVTISSQMSGSYNSALTASRMYEELYADRKVFVIDSRSAGPGLRLIIEKLDELISAGEDYESICKSITRYMKTTKLVFMLESLKNLTDNGRVSPLIAKVAGVLGIRIIGGASEEGNFKLLDKVRGRKKTIGLIVRWMAKQGLKGGKVRIAHCNNEEAALKIKELIQTEFSKCEVLVYKCRGLCSFYAENGGLLVSFET